MLHFLRRHSRSRVIKVTFIAIIAVFVLWGVGAVVGGPTLVSTVATVDQRPIEQIEIQRAERNLLEAYRNAYKDKLTPEMRKALNLRQRALDGLIDRQVLANQAERLGLLIPDLELRDAISSTPAFQVDGRFSKEAYLRALRYAAYTPADYESGLRQELAIQRLQALLEDGVSVSDDAARAEIATRDEKASIAYVKVKASDFTMSVPVTEDDLRRFHEENQSRYTDPERARVELIAYKTERFSSGDQPSEEEITAFYEDHTADRYTQPHEVRARHILIKVPPGADDAARAAARKKIDNLAAKVKGGADFAKLAREQSEDEGSARQGGDLGFFGKGRMAKPFEEAAFALAPGQVSDVVETPFGFHLIRVEDVHDERVKERDEVREDIVKALADEGARAAAKDAAAQDRTAWAAGKNAQEIAAARGLDVEQPAPLQRNDSIPSLGRSFPLTQAIFELAPGGVTEPIDANGTWVVARLVEKLPPAPKELAQVKEQVETAYRLDKAKQLAKEAAEKLLAAAKDAGSLEAAAGAEKREVKTADPFVRAGAYVAGIGGSQELKDAAFRLTESERFPSQVFDVAGDAVVIELVRVERPSAEEVEKQLAEVKKSMLEARRERLFRRYVDELKAQARIEVDRQKLESMPAA